MAHILVLEDDLALSAGLCFELDACGHLTVAAYHCEKARQLLEKEAFDLALFDVNLPDGSGFDLCREVKEKYPNLPVLFLTANDLEEDVLKGFDLGADDYLVKPFDFDELLARLRAMTRKHVGQRTNTLTVGDLTLDTAQRRVTRDGEEIALLPKEFAILEYLMRHPGTVLSREQIEDQIWNYEYAGSSNNVDGYLSRLRKKIDEGRGEKLLHTVRGIGWAIRPPAGGKAP